MIYILLLLSVLFTAPFSANAACGTQSFSNADGETAQWQPTEPNGCEYEKDNGLDCPGYLSNLMFSTGGYHPHSDLEPVYTSDDTAELSFDNVCESNIKQEEIPDPNGGAPLGICYKVYHYEEDRVTGKWSDCLPVSATKSGYHYAKTDTFNFTTHISYTHKTGRLDYGEIVADTLECAEHFAEKLSQSLAQTCYSSNGEIKGQMYWRSENGGYWDAADCTCNYTTTLDWFSTSKADIACKLKLNPHNPAVNSGTTWYDPTDQRESNNDTCYVTQAHACKAGYCIPPNTNGTQCTQPPAGYYHDNDTDTQCQPCPAGTTSGDPRYGQDSISDCFLPKTTVFKDSNGSFTLEELGATENIFYK